jgi:glycerol-3-phosphate dehydrogenase
VPASCTERVPLLGADGYAVLWNQRHQLAASSGLHVARIEHLLNRYGSAVSELLQSIAADPTLAEALPGADDYLRAEALYAVTHEGARHLDDVLARRTRISIESWDRGEAAAPVVAALMATPLGWDEAQVADEVAHYLARVLAERDSQTQPDDASADAARLGAPDI